MRKRAPFLSSENCGTNPVHVQLSVEVPYLLIPGLNIHSSYDILSELSDRVATDCTLLLIVKADCKPILFYYVMLIHSLIYCNFCRFMASLNLETVVEAKGYIVSANIKSCTKKSVELKVFVAVV